MNITKLAAILYLFKRIDKALEGSGTELMEHSKEFKNNFVDFVFLFVKWFCIVFGTIAAIRIITLIIL